MQSKELPITAKSKNMQEVLASIDKVKQSDVNVLIFGETGSGKELVARAVHFGGPRKRKALITINCASIPDNLVESELFGYEKGAFTGAYEKRIGKFELAQGSSIFLDEIGDLPLPAQAKILRMIDNKEFMRVGGSETIKADVLIISATNQDLIQKIKDKSFREDLYFRLSVYPIRVPPLRERREDIPEMVSEFIKLYSKICRKKIKMVSRETMKAFLQYPWPGNIRELQNVIARAITVATDDIITPENLEPKFRAILETEIKPETDPEKPLFLDRAEKRIIQRALRQCGGNKTKAAKMLGIDRVTLYRKIKRIEI